MFKKFRVVFVGSSRSKDDLHKEKYPDPTKTEKPKNKSKLLGLFRSASDENLDAGSKKRRSLLRRKKTSSKELQHEQTNGITKHQTDAVLVDSLPEKSLPNDFPVDNALPDNSAPDDPAPDDPVPDIPVLDNPVLEQIPQDNLVSESVENFQDNIRENYQEEFKPTEKILPGIGDVENEFLVDEPPLQTYDSPPTVRPHPVPVEPFLSDPLPPDDKSWKRAKEVWEKNKTEETKEERKKRKEKKEHSDRSKERDRRKDEKERGHRSKDNEHGAGRAESKSRSRERKKEEKEHKHDKHKRKEHKHEENREKDDKHKHKSKSDKHSRKHHDGDEQHDIRHGAHKDDNEILEIHHKQKDRDKHKHSEKHHKNKDQSRSLHHEDKHKTDEKHSRKHSEKHHKNSPEHSKKHSEPKEDKRIELDKVWREYESGKRYHSTEKDMKKVIDRLDGVEKYRREERQRSSDRSRGFSSDTSCEVGHRSRSKERRRRSRSREKHRHESDQESNPSHTWQYSLGRIEARQEQCKADIDTARRSIEHRIKQLEARLDKQYSSSEKLPEKTTDTQKTGETKDFKNIIDKVADECREVTRTLEVRTEAMKSEIASVVREQFENLDEKLSYRDRCSGSPTSFYRMQLLENPSCDDICQDYDVITPIKTTKPNTATNLKLLERLSSADESMVTVIEENSRIALCSSPDVTDQSQSLATSRDSPVRISQSGALDTLNETTCKITQDSHTPTSDQDTPSEIPDSPLQERSQAFENLYELSLETLEDEESLEEDEEPDAAGTPESQQMMYRRRIREAEERCQERALAEKEILYKRINDLESMLLSARSSKGNYV